MDGAPLTLVLLVGIFALLVAIRLAWQNRELRRQLEIAAGSPALRTAALLDPLKEAPVPAFRANDRGQLVWFNQAFAHLFAHDKAPESLEDASRTLGAPLLTQIFRGGFVKQLKIQRFNNTEQTYGVLRWEQQNGRTVEVSCILLPQNQQFKQQQSQHRFEHDILRYLSAVLEKLQISDIDVREVLATLQALQPQVRKPTTLSHIDLVPLVQQMSSSRSVLRQDGNSISLTSPRSAVVHGDSSDIVLGLTLLTEAVHELQPQGRIVIRVVRKEGFWQLEVQLMNMFISPEDARDAKLLSGTSTLSLHARLRLALVEQLAIKHHGSLTIASERGLGTIFELQLRVAE